MKKHPRILLLGNVTNGDSKSMELVLNEYTQNFNYAKVVVPKVFFCSKFFKLFIYPLVAFFYRGYDGYHVVDHSYGHIVHFLPRNKTIITCHDLIPLIFPSKMSIRGKILFKFYMSGMKRAKIILADTTTSKDLVKLLKINKNKIRTIPNNIDLSSFKILRNRKKLKKKYGLDKKYVIMAQGINFYKNIPRILKALYIVRKRYSNIILLKIGEFGQKEKEIIKQLNLKKNIIQKIGVSKKTLVELYNCTDVLAFPSIYGGYSRPPFEAMACGVPSIVGNKPAFKEIKNDIAIIRINPFLVNELSRAIIKLKEYPSYRKKMINTFTKTLRDFEQGFKDKYPMVLRDIYYGI